MAWAPIVGGGMQILAGLMNGDQDSMQQFQTLSPEQKKFLMGEFNQLQGMQGQNGATGKGMNILQQYLDPNSSIYKNFEKPYMQEFEQQTVPGLAERFQGQGATSGALSSSGFGQALSSAGANLQTNLAGMKSKMQMGAIQSIFDQYNQMANRQTNTPMFGYQQKGANPWSQAMAAGGQGIMQGAMSGWQSGGGGNKFPLTSGYANDFQTGAAYQPGY